MKNSVICSIFVLLCCIALSFTGQAQINMPQPSPAATLTQRVGLMDVTISYSRPSMRGRKIFGDLLPYGELWRTGANAATTIKFSDEVTIEGKKVPAGTYSLFSIPGQNEWTVMLNKNANASANDYKEAEDVARFTVKSQKTGSTYETFTIDLSDITNNTAMLNIKWENTKASLKLEQEVDSKVMAQIKDRMEPGSNVYFQAAMYYMETGKDLKQAMDWMNKATATNPQFWQLYQKARLQAMMKDKKGAVETANKSIELAKKANNNDYVRLNEKLLAELK
jgi:tetratricopeptide (TPR) repeat protein